MPELPEIAGVVLAGGESTRFGSAKAMARLGGRTLIEHVIARGAPQVGRLVVSANTEISKEKVAALPILPDDVGPSWGPLAGILTAMNWLQRSAPDIGLLASFAVDCPFYPLDLVLRLYDASDGGRVPTVVASGGRVHPVFGLWPLSLQPVLKRYLSGAAKASAVGFAGTVEAREVVFSDDPFDPFFNINFPGDLAAAADIARAAGVKL